MRINLKGIHRVRSNNTIYLYAWRGGPALKDDNGKFIREEGPALQKAYHRALDSLKDVDDSKFKSIVVAYKSTGFKSLGDKTQALWLPWLDKITDYFGVLSIKQFNRTELIRPRIIKWRGQYSHTPRAADTGMQAMSRVCAHGIDPLGVITTNPCEGIKHLYKADRSEIIWSDAQITRVKAATNIQVGWAVDLAALTGLRLGDLVRLAWSHVHEEGYIEMPTSKSGKKRNAVIPLYDKLQKLLDSIPRIATTVLTSSKRRPWTEDGFGSSFNDAKIEAKMQDEDLHFHDLRGTAATKLYVANVPIRSIAEILAWDEDSVEKIIRRYVTRGAATQALIAHLNSAGTDPVKKL